MFLCVDQDSLYWLEDEKVPASQSRSENFILQLLLPKAHVWRDIGLSVLGIDRVKIIEENLKECRERLVEVLHCWKSHMEYRLTWKNLISTLRDPVVEQSVLADSIKRKLQEKNIQLDDSPEL